MALYNQNNSLEKSQELNDKGLTTEINDKSPDKEKDSYIFNDEININDKEKEIGKESSLDKDNIENTPTYSPEKEYVINELSF